jgi:exopolysaccharide production protein ExoY
MGTPNGLSGNLPFVGLDLYRAAGKRVFDFLGGFILLLILGPIIGLAILAIRLTSPGGAVFAQKRVGLHGKHFVMYKLRSMYVDHERRVDMTKINEKKKRSLVHKADDDPRVTPVGRWIRKTSIDELPQIWNVVRGDMSLVGPRPLVPYMLEPFPEILTERSQVRPGITGLWQVFSRHDNTSVHGMLKYDMKYVESHSLWILSMRGAQ